MDGLGWMLFVIEVCFIVLVWRDGWRWKALIPSVANFFLQLVLWVVFLGPQVLALASDYRLKYWGEGPHVYLQSAEYQTAMQDLILNHWLVQYGVLFNAVVIGILFLMFGRGTKRLIPGE